MILLFISVLFFISLFQVEVYDTYFHPKHETYIVNIKVTYNITKNRTKENIKNLHSSARAHAAHKFDIELRL